MSAARPCGLVDIGSNSVVLLIASRVGDDWTVLERVKHSVRLGAAIDPSGQLAPAGVLRLQDALADLLSQAHAYSAPLRVTATASLRNVTNGAAIAAELGEQLGCSIEILSEKAEASAAFRGVWDAEGRGAQPMVVVDVGGGSSEVGWGARCDAGVALAADWRGSPLGAASAGRPRDALRRQRHAPNARRPDREPVADGARRAGSLRLLREHPEALRHGGLPG